MKIKDEYRGGFYALGGVSSGTQHGGSGTVYIEEIQGDKLFRRLYIDNQNANPPKVFTLDEMNPKTVKANATEENDAEFGFDELMLQRGVSSYFFLTLIFVTFARSYLALGFRGLRYFNLPNFFYQTSDPRKTQNCVRCYDDCFALAPLSLV